MPYSTYVEYTRQELADLAEQESDLVLTSIVRLQGLVDSSVKYTSQRSAGEEPRAPPFMHVKLVQANLHNFWTSLPAQIQENRQYSHYLLISL
jgi:hypothetical protein